MATRSTKFAAEVRSRPCGWCSSIAVNMLRNGPAITSIATKFGCKAERLRLWVRQAQRDQGLRDGMTTDERARLKALEREARELRP